MRGSKTRHCTFGGVQELYLKLSLFPTVNIYLGFLYELLLKHMPTHDHTPQFWLMSLATIH